jgi:hypothetical protein
MFPSLRGEMDLWKYRSRSPPPFPSKICKNHGRNGGQACKVNNGGEKTQFVPSPRRKKGYLYPPPSTNLTVTVPGAEYPSQVGAEYPPPGFSGQKSAPITWSEPPEIRGSSTRKR